MIPLRRHLLLLLASAVAGGSVVVFELAARLAERVYGSLIGRSTLVVSIAPLALAMIAVAARRWFGVAGSGVPEIVAAHAVDDASERSKWASLRDALARGGLTLAGLACGASIGRQGPGVALGAALVHAAAERGVAKTDATVSRIALEMGAAAGVAAAYNAPIAGVLFAIEQLRITSAVRLLWSMAAVVVASIVVAVLRGTTPHFAAVRVDTLDPLAWLAALPAAALAAVGGALFARAVVGLPALLARWRARHFVTCAVGGAVLLQVLAILASDPLYGTGELEIARMVKGELVASAYPLAKALATLLSISIGLAGGLFGPSIAIGAGIGSAVAHVFAGVPVALLVLSGMAAFLAAATRTPLTAGVFAVEASGQYLLAPVLLAAALLGYALATLMSRVAIYSTPALQLLATAARRASLRTAA